MVIDCGPCVLVFLLTQLFGEKNNQMSRKQYFHFGCAAKNENIFIGVVMSTARHGK